MFSKEVLTESVKELFRVLVLALIPVLVDGISAGGLNLRLILLTSAIALLRGLDKLLHEAGKERGIMNNGLTPF